MITEHSCSYHFLKKFSGSGKVWCLPKESTSQVISGLNPESGKLANKLVNKFDLLSRLISAVQMLTKEFHGLIYEIALFVDKRICRI